MKLKLNMNLWIICTLGIYTISVHCNGYDDSTARIVDVAAHWKPVHTINTAIGPHYLNNKLQLAQIAHHNAHIINQIKGFNPPVTQYRNPFPVFQPAHSYYLQHFVIPKDNVQNFHASASNIAQTVMPSNFLKQTGKPAFHTKSEFISKPDYYNNIQTTVGKVPQHTYYKPTMVKAAATTSLHHDPSSYRDLILTPPPQTWHAHSTLPVLYQQKPDREKFPDKYSFPSEELSSYSFFGPATHLIRGKLPKTQPNIYFSPDTAVGFKNIPQANPNYRSHVTKPNPPVYHENSTPSFLKSSVQLPLQDSFEPNFSKSSFNEVFPPTTSNTASAQYEHFTSAHNHHIEHEALPPIPASVLSPFFHQIQQNNQNINAVKVEQKIKPVDDDFSKNLVPPPFFHVESTSFRSTTTPIVPTRKPISALEQFKSIQILNKYNIPVISPLQNANNFKYSESWLKPKETPQNFTVSSITSFPTNSPNKAYATIQPDTTNMLKTVNTIIRDTYNDQKLQQPNVIERVNSNPKRLPTDHTFLSTPYKDNTEHSFFTIKDAITLTPIGDKVVSSVTSNDIPVHIQTHHQPTVAISEISNPLTTILPRTVIQTLEYSTAAPSSSPLPSAPRTRLRGKNRRRRPRPTVSRTTEQPITEDYRISTNWKETSYENQTPKTTTTTERTTARGRPSRVRNNDQLKITLPPADPTILVVQRNQQKTKLNYFTSMQNRQPSSLSSQSQTGYEQNVIKTTESSLDDKATLNQESYPSTTAEIHIENSLIAETEDDNTIDPNSQVTSISTAVTNPLDSVKVSATHEQPWIDIRTTDSSVRNQKPQEITTDPSSSNEKIEKQINQRQRYKTKGSSETTDRDQPTEIESSTPTLATTSNSTKSVTRLRPVNKYQPKDRPRFSIKDYRQRAKSQSSTTTTEPSLASSTTAGYRSRLRYPTRKRLLPSMRVKQFSTEKSTETANPVLEAGGNLSEEEQQVYFIPDPISTTSTAASRSTTARRGFNTSRKNISRFRVAASSTESSSSAEEVGRKPTTRQRTRERITQKLRVQPSSMEPIIASSEIQMKIEDLNNITIESEAQLSPNIGSKKTESAIMKIIKTDHINRQSAENDANDLNQSPSEQSERVAQLTISGSSYKFNNLNKNNLSRRIPGYFTLATEDPILPIEAFFPNVQNKSNRST